MTQNSGSNGTLAKDIGGILLLAAILAVTYNAFSSKGLPLLPKPVNKENVSDSSLFGKVPDPAAAVRDSLRVVDPRDIKVIAPLHEMALRNPDSVKATVEAAKKQTVYRIISLDQFKRLRSQRRGILFDARTAEDYSVSRIPGARNIPGQEVEGHFEDVAELPRDTLVIIYCNNPDCHLGRMLAEFMSALEFRNILLYDDGWDGWLAAKQPIDTVRIRK